MQSTLSMGSREDRHGAGPLPCGILSQTAGSAHAALRRVRTLEELTMAKSVSRRGFTASSIATAAAMTCAPSMLAAQASPNPKLADEIGRALGAFLASLTVRNRQRTLKAFDDPAREDWHYIPRRRPGATLGDLGDAERRALWDLLGALLSPRGLAQVEGVVRLERILGELTDHLSFRNPDNYAIAVFGVPSPPKPMLMRFEGHHLSLTVVVVPGIGVSVTPSFFGANPALVPERHQHKG